jgi:predicted HAD superfamily Cof-like phosphohydrolase
MTNPDVKLVTDNVLYVNSEINLPQGYGDIRTFSNFESVGQFHKAFGQPYYPASENPKLLEKERTKLRVGLIDEEVDELKDALKDHDLISTVDALVDIVYVCLGFCQELNIDFDKAFNEIHRANMSKLDKNGKPVYRQDGKVIKSDLYIKPDLKKALGL